MASRPGRLMMDPRSLVWLAVLAIAPAAWPGCDSSEGGTDACVPGCSPPSERVVDTASCELSAADCISVTSCGELLWCREPVICCDPARDPGGEVPAHCCADGSWQPDNGPALADECALYGGAGDVCAEAIACREGPALSDCCEFVVTKTRGWRGVTEDAIECRRTTFGLGVYNGTLGQCELTCYTEQEAVIELAPNARDFRVACVDCGALCPDDSAPGVAYISRDLAICGDPVTARCSGSQTLFNDECGCGCISP